MLTTGLNLFNTATNSTGVSNDMLFLKQGEHLMKKGVYPQALFYLTQSLKINPECKVSWLEEMSNLLHKDGFLIGPFSASFSLHFRLVKTVDSK